MLVSDILRRVQNIFGDTSGVQVTLPNVIDWINDGQTDICRKAECLEGIQTINVANGTESYPYAADFIKDQKVMAQGVKLTRMTMQAIDVLYPDRAFMANTGNPLYYYHRNRAITLYPIPNYNLTGGLIVWYIRDAVDVTAVGNTPEVPLIFHEDLVRYCVIRAFELDQEWAAAQQAKQDYDMRLLNTIYDTHSNDSEAYPSVQLIAGDW